MAEIAALIGLLLDKSLLGRQAEGLRSAPNAGHRASPSSPRGHAVGRHRAWRALALGVASLMVLFHLVLAPLLLPIRSESMKAINRMQSLFERAVPKTPGIAEKTVIVLRAPSDGLVSYLPLIRASEHEPRPKHLRLLASGMGAVRVTRPDARTLLVQPAAGFVATTAQQMLRGPGVITHVGDHVDLGDMSVTVTAITPDHRPAAARFRFAQPLESSDYLWLSWGGRGFVPYTPPAIGGTQTLPAIDVAALIATTLAPPTPPPRARSPR